MQRACQHGFDAAGTAPTDSTSAGDGGVHQQQRLPTGNRRASEVLKTLTYLTNTAATTPSFCRCAAHAQSDDGGFHKEAGEHHRLYVTVARAGERAAGGGETVSRAAVTASSRCEYSMNTYIKDTSCLHQHRDLQ